MGRASTRWGGKEFWLDPVLLLGGLIRHRCYTVVPAISNYRIRFELKQVKKVQTTNWFIVFSSFLAPSLSKWVCCNEWSFIFLFFFGRPISRGLSKKERNPRKLFRRNSRDRVLQSIRREREKVAQRNSKTSTAICTFSAKKAIARHDRRSSFPVKRCLHFPLETKMDITAQRGVCPAKFPNNNPAIDTLLLARLSRWQRITRVSPSTVYVVSK